MLAVVIGWAVVTRGSRFGGVITPSMFLRRYIKCLYSFITEPVVAEIRGKQEIENYRAPDYQDEEANGNMMFSYEIQQEMKGRTTQKTQSKDLSHKEDYNFLLKTLSAELQRTTCWGGHPIFTNFCQCQFRELFGVELGKNWQKLAKIGKT